MVVTLDPPAAEAQSTPKKRGGGPRSLAGRNRSRENSVKSSLRSKVVFSKDMAERILDRNRVLNLQFLPKTPYELMLIADMALAKARIDRCAELQIDNENRYIDRTVDYYEYDQRERALKLKKRLSRDPEGIAHKMMGFKQGVEVLITAWEELVRAIVNNGGWDENQCRLCLDMMGLPNELRVGQPLLEGVLDKAELTASAEREIARLKGMLEDWLDEQNEYSRDDALAGLAPELDPTTKRLQRYERMCQRDYEKHFEELKRAKAEGETRSKEGLATASIRPWDVDALIARIKDIREPEGLMAEAAEAAAARRPAPRAAAAPAPAAAVVVPTPPAAAPVAAPAPTAPVKPPIVEATPTPTLAKDESELESPTIDTQADSELTSDEPVEPVPLSRRARKVLQKRLRDAAKREAGKK